MNQSEPCARSRVKKQSSSRYRRCGFRACSCAYRYCRRRDICNPLPYPHNSESFDIRSAHNVLLIIILAAQHLECVENFVLDKPIVEYVGIVKCVSGYPCRVDENRKSVSIPDFIVSPLERCGNKRINSFGNVNFFFASSVILSSNSSRDMTSGQSSRNTFLFHRHFYLRKIQAML